jgi:DUF1680 family protein
MKRKSFVFLCLALLPAGLAVQAGSSYPVVTKAPQDTMFLSARVEPKVVVKAYPFSLKRVRLLPGPFKDAMERDRKYILSLDPDRLLHMFRITAGLPSSAQPYGFWELPDGELRGHTAGHYLSASAFMFASTSDPKIRTNADYVVAELAKCQKAFGASGYLFASPEEFFDRVFSVRRVWAPFYTLHKILAGLLDWYEYGGNFQALDIAENIARWLKSRTDSSDDRHMQIVLNHTEQGGMNEVLSNLYSLTGKPEYLALARRFDQKHYTVPLSKYQDALKGEHANSFIPNIIGMAREYEMTGDRALYDSAKYFWKQVTTARTYVTGGTSNDEHWRTDPYVMSSELGDDSHESCCTYNMLKLTRHLFNWDADPAYADYYERALLNGVLSTQNPENGMMMYSVAMMPGMYKTFMTPENSFWCCTGTGMENHAKYGDSIYFRATDGLFVNLFIASELEWPEKGLKVRQETKFPEEQGTTLVVSAAKPVDLAIHIRIPGWVANGGWVRINSEKLETFGSPSSFLTIRRTWKAGDKVEVSLPMSLRLERLPDDPTIAAVVYGPVVLAGDLGPLSETDEKYARSELTVRGHHGPVGDPVPVPKFLVPNVNPDTWIKPVAGKPLTFQTDGVGKPQDVTLVPFYKLFGERYSIYWTILPPGREETAPLGRRQN